MCNQSKTTSSLTSGQTKAKDHLSGWKVGALFMEAGTGKTRVAVEIVRRSPCDACFWIGALNTIRTREGVPSVKDEVGKWGGMGIPTTYTGIESIQASDRIWLGLLDEVKACRNPFIVVDESLKIKNADAKRTRRMLQLGAMAQYKLILNGTPLSRNLLDLWPQMQFLSPRILGMTLAQFKDTFCEYTKVTKRIGCRRYSKEFITGYENVDYLYSLIRHYVFKCDLRLNITQSYQEAPYELDEDSREEYQRLKEHYLRDETLEWKDNNIFLEMTQKMQHAYCCSPAKVDAVRKILREIPESECLIFCKYVDSRELCRREFPQAAVLSYQKDALGLNLQRYRYTIYFDKTWDYALRIQSGHRTFRTGQEYDCLYWDLTGDVGLEKMIDKNIQKKIGLTEYFKGKTKEELEEEL